MSDRPKPRGGAWDAAQRLRLKLHTDLHQRLDGIHSSLGDLQQRLGDLRDTLADHSARLALIEAEARRTAEIGRHIYDEEPASRRRLHELRRSEEYEFAFTEDEPLVTFIVPTYRSFEPLRDVALPSLLGQDYSNLEVIVSGDAAPPETAAV